jgi:hypothetical protein
MVSKLTSQLLKVAIVLLKFLYKNKKIKTNPLQKQ